MFVLSARWVGTNLAYFMICIGLEIMIPVAATQSSLKDEYVKCTHVRCGTNFRL